MSITENFGSIHVPNPGGDGDDDDDDDELERDAQQKDKELGNLLVNAFDDLVGEDDWDSVDDEDHVHQSHHRPQSRHPNAEELRKQREATLQRLQEFQRADETENVPPDSHVPQRAPASQSRFATKPDPVIYLKPKQQKSEFEARNSRLAELEVLFESRGRELQRLQLDFENQARAHAKEIRSLKHQLAMLQTEKSGVEVTLRGSQELLEDKQKEIAKMRSSLDSLTAEKDRLEKFNRDITLELTTSKGRIACLEEELTELKRSDTLKKVVQSTESKMEGLRETHRKEISEVSEKLLAERRLSSKLSQEVERLKRSIAAKEREWEAELTEKTATVNRLTKLVKDAQNQCAEMVLESQSQVRHEKSEEVLRIQSLESDVLRLQGKNRDLRRELDSTRRELESKVTVPDASFRALMRKDAWEEEKHAIESLCESLKSDLSSQRESHRREMANLASTHRNQLATLRRKLSVVQARMERLLTSKATASRLLANLRSSLMNRRDDCDGKLGESLRAAEIRWKCEWEKAVQVRDARWREEMKKTVLSLKAKHRTETDSLRGELNARNAEIAAASQEFQKLERDFLQSLKKPLDLPVPASSSTNETTSSSALEEALRYQLEERENELCETKRKLAEEKALFRATISEWLAQVEVLKTVKLREAQIVEARLARYKQKHKDLREKLRWHAKLLREQQKAKQEFHPAEVSPKRMEDIRRQLKLKVEEFLCSLDKYS